MQIICRRFFSSHKETVIKMLNPYSNIPQNIISLLDRHLIAIDNHPLSIIKEQIKISLGPKFNVNLELNRASKTSVQ